MDFQKFRLVFWGLGFAMLVLFCTMLANAQLADLDLLEDDDRSVGIAVTRAPDPTSGSDTESRSGILLVPLRFERLKFEGGFGTYFTQALAVVEDDRDAMQATRDSYKQGRDCFKAKYEASVSELSVVKAKLLAYQTQGFWGRVLGRVPVVLPYVEPE